MPTCAEGSSDPVVGNATNGVFFCFFFLVSSWCLVHMGSPSFAGLPAVQDLGYSGVPPAGHALWAEVGGGITFVTSGENTQKSIMLPVCILGVLGDFVWKPYMLVLVGQPSLHGYYACMVYWKKEALRRNCRQKQKRSLFLLLGFFSWVEILLTNSGV